jgi:hypothetical protein
MIIAAAILVVTLGACDETDPLVPDEDFILSLNVYDTEGAVMGGMTVSRLNRLEGVVPSAAFRSGPADPDALGISYPNPFFGSTTVEYVTEDVREALLEVLDWRGEHVKTLVNGRVNAGFYSNIWDGMVDGGGPAMNGVYTLRLTLTDTLDVPLYSWEGDIDCTLFDYMEQYRHDGMGTTDATGFFSTRDLDFFPSLQGHPPQEAYNEVKENIGTVAFGDTVTIRVSTPSPPAGGWIYHMSRDIVLVDGPNYLEFRFVPDDSTGVF